MFQQQGFFLNENTTPLQDWLYIRTEQAGVDWIKRYVSGLALYGYGRNQSSAG